MKHFLRFAIFTIIFFAVQSIEGPLGFEADSSVERRVIVATCAGLVFSAVMLFVRDDRRGSHKVD